MRPRLSPVERKPIYQSALGARGVRLGAAALAAAALAGCGDGPPAAAPAAPGRGEAAAVTRVVDGDTLVARAGGDDVRVRLLGVDAPESVTPGRPVGCYGPQAAAELRRLLPGGTRVTLATDPTQGRHDRFGRLLAEVRVGRAGDTVNVRLVAGGYARVFRGDGRARLLPALRDAERDARRAGRGLWSACS
jgi:micrococcal nuclease